MRTAGEVVARQCACGVEFSSADGRRTRCDACRPAKYVEQKRGQSRRYRANHPDRARAQTAEWVARNKDYNQERWRAYRAANPEARRQADARRWSENKERERQRGAEYRRLNPDKWREKTRRYRARRKGVAAEPYRELDIAARDGWRCGLCRRSINPNTRHPDPLSLSIDHIVPLSAGGADEPHNVRLAHLRCNTSRGAGRWSTDQLRLLA